MSIGDSVEYIDEFGKPHRAIVTAVHQSVDPHSSINVVFVSDDSTRTDQYGRQIQRETSVVHETQQGAHGRYWR